jgi:class 3 adenylate cyclase
MAPRVERKLAAILAADVVGYSRLMQADEGSTHARLKALRQELIEPRVADHAGRIVKLARGGRVIQPLATDDRAHRGVAREPFSIVDIFCKDAV